MRPREYRVLRYVKRHPKVAKKNLYAKYDFLKDDLKYIYSYFHFEDKEPVVDDSGSITGEWQIADNTKFILNHDGYEVLEKKQHDTWLFWFPYIITTIIAAVSVAPTVSQIFNFICSLFSKGSP